MPEQVQDFYPTPSTISTVMYYTGVDPVTMKPVYVCRNPHEKAMQRALIQYRNPKNHDLVRKALTLAGREDLIGYDRKCLIRPRKPADGTMQNDSRQNRKNMHAQTVWKKDAQKPKKKKTIRNVHKQKNVTRGH